MTDLPELSPADVEAERLLFDAWVAKSWPDKTLRDHVLRLNQEGDYDLPLFREAFNGWFARAKLAHAERAEYERACIILRNALAQIDDTTSTAHISLKEFVRKVIKDIPDPLASLQSTITQQATDLIYAREALANAVNASEQADERIKQQAGEIERLTAKANAYEQSKFAYKDAWEKADIQANTLRTQLDAATAELAQLKLPPVKYDGSYHFDCTSSKS